LIRGKEREKGGKKRNRSKGKKGGGENVSYHPFLEIRGGRDDHKWEKGGGEKRGVPGGEKKKKGGEVWPYFVVLFPSKEEKTSGKRRGGEEGPFSGHGPYVCFEGDQEKVRGEKGQCGDRCNRPISRKQKRKEEKKGDTRNGQSKSLPIFSQTKKKGKGGGEWGKREKKKRREEVWVAVLLEEEKGGSTAHHTEPVKVPTLWYRKEGNREKKKKKKGEGGKKGNYAWSLGYVLPPKRGKGKKKRGKKKKKKKKRKSHGNI